MCSNEIRTEKISVIIPVYNVEKYLDTMVSSVVNQTYQNLEIILVDDGSADGSGKLCDTWEKRDSRIKCIHQENSGVSAARNVGFRVSEGDYILFLDADDEIASEMCEKMMNALISHDADLSYCGFWDIYKDRTEKNIPRHQILLNDEITYALITDCTFFTSVWNKLYKRSMLVDAEGSFFPFEPGIFVGEDELWLFYVLKKAGRAVAVPEALYYWKRRMDSATRGGDKERIDEKFLTVLKVRRTMMLEEKQNKNQAILIRRYLGLCRDCCVIAYKKGENDLVNELLWEIKKYKYLYKKQDLFFFKLYLCTGFVQWKVPSVFVEFIMKSGR